MEARTGTMRSLLLFAVMLALVGACVAVVAAPRANAGVGIDCSNTGDDDGDGLIDLADPGCETGQDNTEGPMTGQLAHAAVGRFLDDFLHPVRRLISCHKADGRFRCSFSVRQRRNFRYKGKAVTYNREYDGGGGQTAFVRITILRGRCGRINRNGPFSIRTKNVTCASARHDIRAWYYRHRPLPYDCFLRAVPFTARCHYNGRTLSFKYRDR